MIDDIKLALDTAYWAVQNRQWHVVGPLIAVVLRIVIIRTVQQLLRIVDTTWNFLFRRGADK